MENDIIIANHIKDKTRSLEFKRRRFVQWNENYAMYRNKIVTNRLTQRQAINLPIIRESIQTWISKIDESPLMNFETRAKGNKAMDGQIYLNEVWAYYYDKLKLDLVDNLEKKVVGLTGRGFKKLGWSKNSLVCDVIDPYDIDIDPTVNALDLNTANYVIHKNIFRSLRSILADTKYLEEGKATLKEFLSTQEGIFASSQAEESYLQRQERLRLVGVENYDTHIKSGDVIVELNEVYKMMWDEKEKRFIRHIIVIAADKAVLANKSLKDALGITRLNIVSWASDPDLNDIWSDGIADNVSVINKVVNMYISQDLENRTYRNFGMYFYNTLQGNFKPNAFDPKPFGMYGVPGNPREIVQQMQIEPLGDTAQQITFLKNLIQSSVAQTPLERGEQQTGAETLGEVKLSLQQSQGVNNVVSKQFRSAWEEFGRIAVELIEANTVGPITIWKKGGDGQYYTKDIFVSDWKNPAGYECKVTLKAEKDAADDFDLKKLQFAKNSFPNNIAAQNIIKRKELELLNFSVEEIESIMQSEEAAQQQAQQSQMPQTLPEQNQIPQ